MDFVIARLISKVDKLTESNCFLTAKPLDEPPAAVRNMVFCTVSPTDSQYDQGAHEGGGINATFELAGVEIVVYNAVRLDQVGHDAAALTDAARGLLILKHDILRALSGHDLQDGNGNEILINMMAPLLSGSPRSIKGDGDRHVGDISLQFSTDFEWNLT